MLANVRRVVWGGVMAGAAFLSGSAAEPADAGAHCGDHGGSCGGTWVWKYNYCDGTFMHEVDDVYQNNCSGTCYNNNTQGCCDSPDACWNAACKPGGCGGPCAYWYTVDNNLWYFC